MDNLLPFQTGFVFSPFPPRANINLFFGPTEAACISARDAYFTSNPSALDAYANNPTRLIRLVVEGETENTYLHQAYINGRWESLLGFGETQGGGTGNVIGPPSSTQNAIARYADASGEVLADSNIINDGTNLTYQSPVGGTAGSAYKNSAGDKKGYIHYDDDTNRLDILADGSTNGINISSGSIGTQVVSDGPVFIGGTSTTVRGSAIALSVGPPNTPISETNLGDSSTVDRYIYNTTPEGNLTGTPYSVCLVSDSTDPDNSGLWVLNSATQANTPWVPVGTIGSGSSGDVVGPATSTANALARYEDSTGKLLADSNILTDGTNITYQSPAAGTGGSIYKNSAGDDKAFIRYDDTANKLDISADGAANGIDISSGVIGTRVVSDGPVRIGGTSTTIGTNALTLSLGPPNTPITETNFGDGATVDRYVYSTTPEGNLTGTPYSVCLVSDPTTPSNSGLWVLNSATAANTPWVPVGTIGAGSGGGFTSVIRELNQLTFTGAGGATALIPDLYYSTATFGGNLVIDNSSSGSIVRCDNSLLSVSSSLAAPVFKQGDVFALDLTQKDSSVTFTLQDTTSSRFEDNSTQIWLQNKTITIFRCMLENPDQPQSATNKLVYTKFAPARTINGARFTFSGPNNVIINNVSEERMIFESTFTGDIIVQADPVTFTNESVFELDLKEVPVPITFSLQDNTTSEIQGGVTSIVLPPLSVVSFKCLTGDRLQPQSATNKLIYYYSIQSAGTDPDQNNTFYCNPSAGGITPDGKNRAKAFGSYQDAIDAAAAVPAAQYKQVVIEEISLNLPPIINTPTVNDIQNLVISAKASLTPSITLLNTPTIIEIGAVSGSISINQGSFIASTLGIGSSAADTITFTAEPHLGTFIKASRVTATIDFSNIVAIAGPKAQVRLEIDSYAGDVPTALATLDPNVVVTGWLDYFSF